MMTQHYGANNVMGIYIAKDVLKNVTWMQVNTISIFPLYCGKTKTSPLKNIS